MRSCLPPWGFRRRSAAVRRGLSLLEVLLALGIFLIALTGIGQLISSGSRAAVDARLEAEATLRAESILQELLAGVQPLQSTSATAFSDNADWLWSAEVLEGPHVDLVQVTVTVFRQDLDNPDRGTVRLTRLVRDPQLFLDAALQAQ
jgi:prepilin-type N-terminal cleavage/methylation domain-containing protein